MAVKSELVCDEPDAIWHQRDDETDTCFHYFNLYLDLGAGRRITQMREVYEDMPSITRLNKISSQNDWRLRARAYDDYKLQDRRRRYEARLDKILDEEFEELHDAYKTSHVLRKRIENDTSSSTYSLLNAWKNWVEAHNKISDEMYMIAGKPKEAPRPQELKAFEQTETKKVTEREKIEEVTKALRMIKE